MSDTKYTELDFATIKNNLKNYLKSQDKFKDYNFDGSGISILLDILAYNTGYNAFYLNMLASEMFLDSASMRESVVSRAKHLGYVPRSVTTLSAVVDIIIQFNSKPQDLLISSSYEFYTNIEGTRYTFTPRKSAFLEPYAENTYIVRNLELIEGKKLTYRWTVDNTSPVKQRFIIPSDTVDLSTVKVLVQKSATDNSMIPYRQFNDINTLTPKDEVFFIQAAESNKYEIVFGDNILGKAPENGNIISVEYVTSSGAGATGATNFVVNTFSATVFSSALPGQIRIIPVTPARGFVERESIESIKLVAPRSYDTQNRAVTKSDYETILKRDIPIIEHMRVWGGEENDPPEYGKVFCAIKPITGYSLSEDDKQNLINSYIRPRNIISLETIIVEPEYFRMAVQTKVNYFGNRTNKTAEDLKSLVLNAIKTYRTKSLVGFDSDFRHSKLVKLIDAVDSSIESNLTSVQIKYRLTPAFDVSNIFKIKLNNEIDTGDAANGKSAVNSTPFFYKNVKVMLADDGVGTLFLYYYLNNKRVIINPNVGTVNYSTGQITITDLVISGIPDSKNYIDVIITPKESDIIVLRNQLLLLEDDDIQVDMTNLNRLTLS